MSDDYYIRRFGLSDGLQDGSRLASSILITSMIALSPGFQSTDLLFMSGLVFAFGTIIEFPISHWADNNGWCRSIKISTLASLLFAISVFICALSSLNNNLYLKHFSMLLYGFFCASSNAFFRSPYQAAYLKWYENSHLKDKRSLFISSYKFSFIWRVLSVFILLSLALLSQLTFVKNGIFMRNELNYIVPIFGFILCAWLFRFVMPWIDLTLWDNHRTILKSTSPKNSLKEAFNLSQDSFPYLIVCAYCWLTRNLINAVFIGKCSRELITIGFDLKRSWFLGITIAVFINILNIFLSKIVFRYISSKNVFFTMRVGTMILVLSSISSTIIYFFKLKYFYIICLIYFCLIPNTVADVTRLAVISNINKIIKNDYKASWISISNLMSYMLYGFISLSVFIIGDPQVEMVIIFGVCFFLGIIAYLSVCKLDAFDLNLTLKSVYSKGFWFLVAGIVTIQLYSAFFLDTI